MTIETKTESYLIQDGRRLDGSSLAGKSLEDITYLGEGSLTSRLRGRIGKELVFAKTALSSENCPGATSIMLLQNEDQVQRYIAEHTPTEQQQHVYLGYTEVKDWLCLLFKDISPLHSRNQNQENKMYRENSLAGKINTNDDIIIDPRLRSVEKKVKVIATNINGDEHLKEAVFIAKEVASQAHYYHQLKKSGRGGIIHTDISPGNVLIYVDTDGKYKVLLSDFGLARENGKDPLKLFNKLTPGRVGGIYYSSDEKKFLKNNLYHPPNVDIDYINSIDPTYDTYNITNLLCLMLTGKLVEFWRKDYQDKLMTDDGEHYWSEEKFKVVPDELRRSLNTKLKQRHSGLSDKQRDKLVEIIVRGTHQDKAQRYSSAAVLQEELSDLVLEEPSGYKPNPIGSNFPTGKVPNLPDSGWGIIEPYKEYRPETNFPEIDLDGKVITWINGEAKKVDSILFITPNQKELEKVYGGAKIKAEQALSELAKLPPPELSSDYSLLPELLEKDAEIIGTQIAAEAAETAAITEKKAKRWKTIKRISLGIGAPIGITALSLFGYGVLYKGCGDNPPHHHCGNGVCETEKGENPENCPEDCGDIPPPVCISESPPTIVEFSGPEKVRHHFKPEDKIYLQAKDDCTNELTCFVSCTDDKGAATLPDTEPWVLQDNKRYPLELSKLCAISPTTNKLSLEVVCRDEEDSSSEPKTLEIKIEPNSPPVLELNCPTEITHQSGELAKPEPVCDYKVVDKDSDPLKCSFSCDSKSAYNSTVKNKKTASTSNSGGELERKVELAEACPEFYNHSKFHVEMTCYDDSKALSNTVTADINYPSFNRTRTKNACGFPAVKEEFAKPENWAEYKCMDVSWDENHKKTQRGSRVYLPECYLTNDFMNDSIADRYHIWEGCDSNELCCPPNFSVDASKEKMKEKLAAEPNLPPKIVKFEASNNNTNRLCYTLDVEDDKFEENIKCMITCDSEIKTKRFLVINKWTMFRTMGPAITYPVIVDKATTSKTMSSHLEDKHCGNDICKRSSRSELYNLEAVCTDSFGAASEPTSAKIEIPNTPPQITELDCPNTFNYPLSSSSKCELKVTDNEDIGGGVTCEFTCKGEKEVVFPTGCTFGGSWIYDWPLKQICAGAGHAKEYKVEVTCIDSAGAKSNNKYDTIKVKSTKKDKPETTSNSLDKILPKTDPLEERSKKFDPASLLSRITEFTCPSEIRAMDLFNNNGKCYFEVEGPSEVKSFECETTCDTNATITRKEYLPENDQRYFLSLKEICGHAENVKELNISLKCKNPKGNADVPGHQEASVNFFRPQHLSISILEQEYSAAKNPCGSAIVREGFQKPENWSNYVCETSSSAAVIDKECVLIGKYAPEKVLEVYHSGIPTEKSNDKKWISQWKIISKCGFCCPPDKE